MPARANSAVLMVEILLNTRTGAPTAPHYGDRERARVDAKAQSNPVNTPNFVQQVVPALAPDVLLAAQQTRDTDRVRSFERRQAQVQDQDQDQDQADIAAQARQAAEQITAEIIPLYDRGTAYSNDRQDARNTPPPVQSDFSRANQAYVRAGASDGRAFAATGFDTASLQTLSPSVNLII